jgi:hypothetical protein
LPAAARNATSQFHFGRFICFPPGI